MNYFKTILYFAVIVVITLLTIKCVSNFAGGTGDVDNKTICGKLFEPDGINPARGATVVIRPNDYLPGITCLPKRSANDSDFIRLIHIMHTNDSGYYKFDSIPKGIYCIEGRDNSNNCVFRDSIKIDSLLIDIDTLLLQDTLKPPATAIIEGKIQPYNDSTQAYIRVFGLDVYEKVSSNGNFYLYDLPQGNLKLRITIIRGTLTSYDTMEIITKADDTAIIVPGYIIEYNGNENTTGIAPVDDKYYKAGEMATVLGNSGNLVRNCHTFIGWNTESNGSGTTYKPDDTFEMGKKNVTLYAQWTKDYYNYIVAFEKNDTAASGTMAAETISCGSSAKLNANEFTKTGWTFAGWATSPSGAVSYADGESYTMGTANVTLYAKWNSTEIVVDIDGNVYHTVTIGTQTWMVENLKTTKFNDGTQIPPITNKTVWASCTTHKDPGYCWYNNDSATYKSAYGALYNWYTVNTGKLAPAGWHVPTDAEWDILQHYLIANGYNWDGETTLNRIAKSLAAQKDWISNTTEGIIGCDLTKNNRSGFSTLPGGARGCDGSFGLIGNLGSLWSTTEDDTSNAWTRALTNSSDGLGRQCLGKSYGQSVRLLRDGNPMYSYTVTFNDQSATTPANPTSKTVISPATTIDALPTPPSKTGYTFGGWYTSVNGNGTEFTTSSVVTANDTVYANWNSYPYTVTFDDQSATTSSSPTSKTLIAPATTIDALPTPPTKTGCIFSGWYTEVLGGGTEFVASTIVTSSIKVYAKWAITDFDGNVYTTVTIGTQTWTVENLKTTKYNDGTDIPFIPDSTSWANRTMAGFCWYHNDSAAYKSTYGTLYNWYTVNTGKLAPAGWHVPTVAEWDILENYLVKNGYNWYGTTAGNLIAKSLADKKDWILYTTEGTIGCDLTMNNRSGFSALPGGFRYGYGDFDAIGNYGSWWSATEYDTSNAWTRALANSSDGLGRLSIGKSYGVSVRLLRD